MPMPQGKQTGKEENSLPLERNDSEEPLNVQESWNAKVNPLPCTALLTGLQAHLLLFACLSHGHRNNRRERLDSTPHGNFVLHLTAAAPLQKTAWELHSRNLVPNRWTSRHESFPGNLMRNGTEHPKVSERPAMGQKLQWGTIGGLWTPPAPQERGGSG